MSNHTKATIRSQFYRACQAGDLKTVKAIAWNNPHLNYPLQKIVTEHNISTVKTMLLVAKDTPGVVSCKKAFERRMKILDKYHLLEHDEFLDLFLEDGNLILFYIPEVLEWLFFNRAYKLLKRVVKDYHHAITMTEKIFIKITQTNDMAFIKLVLQLFPNTAADPYLKFSAFCEMISLIQSNNYKYFFLVDVIKENIDSLKQPSDGVLLHILRGDKDNHCYNYEIFAGSTYCALSVLDTMELMDWVRERYPEESHDNLTVENGNGKVWNDWLHKNFPNYVP